MKASAGVLMALLSVSLVFAPILVAQDLEGRVNQLETQVENLASGGLVLFLFGAFCALWAQNTGRSAWGWFFLGLFFGPITAVVLLAENAKDLKRQDAARGATGNQT